MITDTSVFGCPFSDYCFIAAKLNLKQIKENKTSFSGRLLSEHNLESIINQLEKTDFSLDCSTLGVNELWLQIKSLILDATNNIAPLKDIKLKKRDFFPWVDSELIELKQCRDHLFNLKQSTKSPNDLAKYKEYRTAYQSLNRNKMIDYFKNMKLSDFKNSKNYWQFYSASIRVKSDKGWTSFSPPPPKNIDFYIPIDSS